MNQPGLKEFVDLFILVVLAGIVVALFEGKPAGLTGLQRVGAGLSLAGAALFLVGTVHRKPSSSDGGENGGMVTPPPSPPASPASDNGAGVVGVGGSRGPGVVGIGGDGGPGVRGVGGPGAPGVVGRGGEGGPGVVGIGGRNSPGVVGIGGAQQEEPAKPSAKDPDDRELASLLERFSVAEIGEIAEAVGTSIPAGPQKKSVKIRALVQNSSGAARAKLVEFARGQRKL